jgi:hypothetical protein
MRRRLSNDEQLALHDWLRSADGLYIDGRLLWFNVGIDGSTILLWLSLEQILKLLIFQSLLKKSLLTTSDGQTAFGTLEDKGKRLNHGYATLVNTFDEEYPRLLTASNKEVLEKLHEFFNRRYASNTPTSIALNLIEPVDRLYFKLRDHVSSQLRLAYIDEIGFRLAIKFTHPLEQHMQYAYLGNKYFRRRKRYPAWRVSFDNLQYPIYTDSGRSTPIRIEES